MKKDDGGAAFPVTEEDYGMTIRDWFAGQVIVGLLASGGLKDVTSEGFARRAYWVADAMIAERNKEGDK